MENKYPECEKMREVKDKSQVVGEFLEWLLDKGVFLSSYSDSEFKPTPIVSYNYQTEKLLAEFFDIDLKKVEEEKRQMLKELHNK